MPSSAVRRSPSSAAIARSPRSVPPIGVPAPTCARRSRACLRRMMASPGHREAVAHGDLGGARSVGRRLILDTNILIAYERGTIDRSSLDDDELAIASITVAEYRAGIELADTAERAPARPGARHDHVRHRCAGLHRGDRGPPRTPARPRPPVRYPARRGPPDHRRPRGATGRAIISRDQRHVRPTPLVSAIDA